MAIKNYPRFWEGKGKGNLQLQKIVTKILKKKKGNSQ
jgi:hypothetical protein